MAPINSNKNVKCDSQFRLYFSSLFVLFFPPVKYTPKYAEIGSRFIASNKSYDIPKKQDRGHSQKSIPWIMCVNAMHALLCLVGYRRDCSNARVFFCFFLVRVRMQSNAHCTPFVMWQLTSELVWHITVNKDDTSFNFMVEWLIVNIFVRTYPTVCHIDTYTRRSSNSSSSVHTVCSYHCRSVT